MRRLVGLLVVIILGAFMSVLVVDERQMAIVTGQTGRIATYKPGIHFAWPVWDTVTYVYINHRNSILRLDLVNEDPAHPKLQLELLANWRVDNPEIYVSFLNRLKKQGFDQALTQEISRIIAGQLDLKTLVQVNQSGKLLVKPEKLNNLGIMLNAISINSLQVINGLSESSTTVTNLATIAPITSPLATSKAESNASAVKAMKSVAISATIQIESAYYQAQVIKGEAVVEVSKINQGLLIQDPKFYEYFSKLNSYKASAKAANDMPAMSDLYKQ
jgi:regulator of protease activity HflC (stomatin/prohibitin superfamily)